jgi:hypothetical protein
MSGGTAIITAADPTVRTVPLESNVFLIVTGQNPLCSGTARMPHEEHYTIRQRRRAAIAWHPESDTLLRLKKLLINGNRAVRRRDQ